jgi:hypothetical protein
MSRELTELQKKFLEYLFGEAQGDPAVAKKMAGYSQNYPTSAVIESLNEEIVEHTRLFLTRNGAKAAMRLVGVMDNPERLGTKEILAAAKDVLDRIGVVKTEKIDINSNGIFVLPAKQEDRDDEDL